MLAFATLVGGLVCRAQAASALRAEIVERSRSAGPRPVDSGCRPWSDNPIVVREARRDARNLSGGPVQAALCRYGAILLPVLSWGGLTACVAAQDGMRALLFSFLLLLLLLFLQPLRAASRSSGAVLDERESRTLDSLSMTGLSPREFVDGWAEVAWRPVLTWGSPPRYAAPAAASF
ncbi:MAG: hypothetical protein HY319_21380 [Armatimonadetes bacterium]|nr:hypothetical protein [Armatimonadota bacterium]